MNNFDINKPFICIKLKKRRGYKTDVLKFEPLQDNKTPNGDNEYSCCIQLPKKKPKHVQL